MDQGNAAPSTETPEARSHRNGVKRAFALTFTAGLMLVVGAGVFMVTGIAGAEDDGEPAAEIPTGTATATPIPTPAGPPPPPVGLNRDDYPELKVKRVPLGPITSDRAVVHTGDGDCLNVRPVPSKLFESDPRFCLNEGEIVYLHGDAIDADGEQWRYALGRGWLATQYVRMEPRSAENPLGGFASVFLLDASNGWPGSGGSARMDADGRLERIATFKEPNGQPGENLRFSPDGEWVAYTISGPAPSLRIVDLRSGDTRAIDGAAAIAWSEDGKLLLSSGGCDSVSCDRGPAWMYPGDAAPRPLGEKLPQGQDLVWAPDGESVVGTIDGRKVVRYWLDGRHEVLIEQLPEDVWLGELSVSPDDGTLLAGGIAGPLRIVDPETSAISEFQRAPQPSQPGNMCGGSIGKLSDWLGGGRVVYHESLAAKGSNGITIGDLRTGQRKVLSFWNIADLDAIGPDLVTFTSFEQINDVSFQLTWLLDTTTGEARPVAVGMEAGWVK
ncbi:MAG: WD40 repeat domain-containing protein [Dehalococcoidia bacterium]